MAKMTKTNSSGFAILLAVLLVSIVLTVSLTIFNITYRQLILSSLARESQFAFYASDSARYCARYYDLLTPEENRPFAYTNDDVTDLDPDSHSSVTSVRCNGLTDDEVSEDRGESNDYWVYRFTTIYEYDNRTTCADVTLYKYRLPYDDDGNVDPGHTGDGERSLGKTELISRGYNNYAGPGASPCHKGDERTVERASRMLY